MAERDFFWCIVTSIHILLIHIISAHPATSDPASGLTLPTRPPWSGCVDQQTWQQTHIDLTHCLEALELFRQTEFQKVQTQNFEFISPGARGRTGLLPISTPRRYTVGTCTITVALLGSIPRPLLPAGTHSRSRFPPTDVATFEELRAAGRGIYDECITDAGMLKPSGSSAGWQTKGHVSGALGVFMWQTGSRMDKTIKDLYPDWKVGSGSTNDTSTA
ncbi:MAG: hypothetical protein Q9202_005107 [Teloschistes flavicans]